MRRVSVSQRGAAHLLLALLIVVVVGVVGYAAYYVSVSQKDKKAEVSQTDETNSLPDKLESGNDFEQASRTLDADENDASTDPAQLDADLNSLL